MIKRLLGSNILSPRFFHTLSLLSGICSPLEAIYIYVVCNIFCSRGKKFWINFTPSHKYLQLDMISYHNFLMFLGLLVYYYIIMYRYILYYCMYIHIIICIYTYYLINLFISLNISMFKSWISMTPEHLIWKCISKICISEWSLVFYYYTHVDACPGLIPELWQKKLSRYRYMLSLL